MSDKDTIAMLEIERTINAGRQEVFDALSKPEIMAKWFFGMEGGSAKVETDFRVGGAYVINMFKSDGEKEDCAEYAPHGEYLEIAEPETIAFTWISEGFVEHSVVTIKLLESEDETTLLTLTHELPASTVEPHREGWNACLKNLVELKE